MKAQLLKPFARFHEGAAPGAVVAYGKRPWGRKFADEPGQTVVVQWAHVLTLDLWLIKLRFDWLGKQGDRK